MSQGLLSSKALLGHFSDEIVGEINVGQVDHLGRQTDLLQLVVRHLQDLEVEEGLGEECGEAGEVGEDPVIVKSLDAGEEIWGNYHHYN